MCQAQPEVEKWFSLSVLKGYCFKTLVILAGWCCGRMGEQGRSNWTGQTMWPAVPTHMSVFCKWLMNTPLCLQGDRLRTYSKQGLPTFRHIPDCEACHLKLLGPMPTTGVCGSWLPSIITWCMNLILSSARESTAGILLCWLGKDSWALFPEWRGHVTGPMYPKGFCNGTKSSLP